MSVLSSQLASIAQLVEHSLSKRKVLGSNPSGGMLFFFDFLSEIHFYFCELLGPASSFSSLVPPFAAGHHG